MGKVIWKWYTPPNPPVILPHKHLTQPPSLKPILNPLRIYKLIFLFILDLITVRMRNASLFSFLDQKPDWSFIPSDQTLAMQVFGWMGVSFFDSLLTTPTSVALRLTASILVCRMRRFTRPILVNKHLERHYNCSVSRLSLLPPTWEKDKRNAGVEKCNSV